MALTPDQEKLKEAALAADKHGHHVCVNARDSDNWEANQAWHYAATPAAILAILAQLEQVQADADRFAMAIALDDNAEGLYAAVMSNCGNGALIRAQFDADMALSPATPPPEAA